MTTQPESTTSIWDRVGGRSFVAFLAAVLAWAVATGGVFLKATKLPSLDTGALLAASGILTGGASVYALRSAASDLSARPQIVQPPAPTTTIVQASPSAGNGDPAGAVAADPDG
jgi:hypothetical protein